MMMMKIFFMVNLTLASAAWTQSAMIHTVVAGDDGAGLLELMITMTTTVTQAQCHPPDFTF